MSAKKTKLIVAEVRQIAFSICSDVARKILIEAAERLEETDKIAEFTEGGRSGMSREKQIEEMANVMHDGCSIVGGTERCRRNHCFNCSAITLYEKGYRLASDVALETVDNFQSRLRNIFCTMCNDNDYNTVCLLEIDSAIECLFDAFVAELKKKYAEAENDDG